MRGFELEAPPSEAKLKRPSNCSVRKQVAVGRSAYLPKAFATASPVRAELFETTGEDFALAELL